MVEAVAAAAVEVAVAAAAAVVVAAAAAAVVAAAVVAAAAVAVVHHPSCAIILAKAVVTQIALYARMFARTTVGRLKATAIPATTFQNALRIAPTAKKVA